MTPIPFSTERGKYLVVELPEDANDFDTVRQPGNKRTNVYYTANGVTKMQKDWVIELGVALSQILRRIKGGRTFEETYNYYKSKYQNKGT